jgi:hypothetical protein
MKRFTFIVAVVLGLFVGANVISYFVFSDGHGVGTVYDGIQRAGFPWLFWERGGFVYRHTFSTVAFAADLAVAVVAGILVSVLYRSVRR